MAHTPKDYQPLRDAHQQALDALNSHIDQTQTSGHDAGAVDVEPTRPEGVYRQAESWPMDQSLPAQNRAANQQFERSLEHQSALDALNEHVDRADAGETIDKTQDIGRAPEPDIER